MKHLQKLFTLLMGALLILSVASCGNSGGGDDPKPAETITFKVKSATNAPNAATSSFRLKLTFDKVDANGASGKAEIIADAANVPLPDGLSTSGTFDTNSRNLLGGTFEVFSVSSDKSEVRVSWTPQNKVSVGISEHYKYVLSRI